MAGHGSDFKHVLTGDSYGIIDSINGLSSVLTTGISDDFGPQLSPVYFS